MKKLITIGLAAAMTFAVATQVKAAVPLETSGELRVRMFYLDSYTGAVAKNGATNEFWDQRLRLTLTWPVAENVKLVVRGDALEGLWGDNGAAPVADTPAKAKSIDFDWVNMQFKWPGTPLAFTIGRQDASWGPGIASKSDPRDRFKIVGAFDFGTLIALYQKRAEVFAKHDTDSLDDNRQYAVAYIGKGGGFTFGLLELATFNNADASVDTSSYTTSVYAIGKAGPVDLSTEIVYVMGENDFAAKADQDLQGIGAYLGAFIPAGPVTIGVEGAYAGGDKASSAKNEGAFKFDYHSPFWSIVLFNNMDLNGYAGETSVAGNTSLTNAMAAKLTVTAKPAAGLTIIGAAVYAARDQVAAGKKKPMGTELDLIFVYAITPNVSWTVGAGYLLPGDYYGDVDNALAAKSQFVLNF